MVNDIEQFSDWILWLEKFGFHDTRKMLTFGHTLIIDIEVHTRFDRMIFWVKDADY